MTSIIHSPKIYAIENLRGIAALAVCAFHLTGKQSSLAAGTWWIKTASYGYLGVPIFFAVSGFVIPWVLYNSNYKTINFFSYMLKRFVRIAPPYLVSIILLLVLNYLSSLNPLYLGKPFFFDIKQFLTHIIFLPELFGYNWYQPVYYTLLIEFQFYIVCGLLFPLFASSKIRGTYVLIILSLLLCYFFPFYLFAHFDSFLVGIIFFQYKRGHITIKQFWLMQIVIIGFSLINNTDKNIFIAELLTAIALIYWNGSGKITKFLASISYSLYLIHVPIGGRFINLTERYTSSIYSSGVFLLIGIALCIFCAWIFYKLVELPTIRYSRLLISRF